MRISTTHDTTRAVRVMIGWTAAAGVALLLAMASHIEAGLPPQATGGPAATLDPRWEPWLGCWELSNGISQDAGSPAIPGEPSPAAHPSAEPTMVRVCVTPAGSPFVVNLTTEVQGGPAFVERFVADGSEQPMQDGGCRGSRVAEWSHNGLRLFSRATFTCADEPAMSISHFATIVGGTWFDIQGITRNGRQGVRVRRYRRASAERPGAETGCQLGIEDVREASEKVTSLVLQAALVETSARFILTGRTMLALDRAGVPDEVTDLMVALSYPNRFRVTPPSPAPGGRETYEWASWQAGYWYPEDLVIVGGDGGGGDTARPAGSGHVVNNRGYTRIDPVRHEANGERGEPAPSGDTSSTSSSGESGNVSSQGYSGGGSSGDDRTAQPRPPED